MFPQTAQTIPYSDLPLAQAGSALAAEWNTYRREVQRLLAEGSEGKYALIKGDQIVGVFDSWDAARQAGLAQFLLAPRVDQRPFGAFDDGNLSSTRLLRSPEGKHGRGFDPLIAAYRRDAEQVNLRCTQQHEQREEIRALRATAILVSDDLDFLLRARQSTREHTCKDQQQHRFFHGIRLS